MKDPLFSLQDKAYKAFNAKLLPTVDPDTIIGVRVPQLRALAKTICRDDLGSLPHVYYEENCLHAFCIENIQDYGQCILALEEFLPYVDNWAVCDGMRPKCFKEHKTELLKRIHLWMQSDHPYTVRFAIEMLMIHYLDESFLEEYPKMVSVVYSDNYYVNMMIAWYFATALAKQYDVIIGFLEEKRLPVWVHNKTIQKAIESYRITAQQKAYLKTLKLRSPQE